jgi:hypothetical protein
MQKGALVSLFSFGRMQLAKAGGRIGARRQLPDALRVERIRAHFGGSGMWKAHAGVPVQMVFTAGWAVALAGVLVAEAGELVATANAIAIAGGGSGFQWNQWHFALRQTITWGLLARKWCAPGGKPFIAFGFPSIQRDHSISPAPNSLELARLHRQECLCHVRQL